MQIEEFGKELSNARINFKLPGLEIEVDFIDREGFKIVAKRHGEKPDKTIEVGRKGQTVEKAINDALNFANLTLEEGAQVQGEIERFLDKYFNTPAPAVEAKVEEKPTVAAPAEVDIVEECAAQ